LQFLEIVTGSSLRKPVYILLYGWFMHRTHKTTTAQLLRLTCIFAAVQAMGCVSKDSGVVPDAGDVSSRPDAADNTPVGSHHQFVVDQFIVPGDQTQAQELALNLDGAGGGDNKLGEILSVLGDLGGEDIQANVDAQVARGEMVILANLQATALDSAQATGLWIFRGDVISPNPCVDDDDTVCAQHLDGGGTFASLGDTDSSLIYGDISAGVLTGGPGRVTLDIPLVIVPQPLTMNLVGVRVSVEVADSGLSNGRLGGAVTVDEINDNILPQLVVVMQSTVQQDCNGVHPQCCTAGSQGEDLIGTFDSDGSCDVTLDELKDNALLSGLLSPDLDLFDAEGFYVPNDDGVKDSLSLGVGFSASLGGFQLPPGINP
jgi:hypothetical protein